jgi:hypothetical protein
MLGDFPAIFGLRTVFVPAFQTLTTTRTVMQTTTTTVTVTNDLVTTITQTSTTTTNLVPVVQQRVVEVPVTVRVPVPFEGSFKVAEDESPRPEDRVIVGYNFYGNLGGPGTPQSAPHLETTFPTIDGNRATVTTLVPGAAPRFDLHREVVGFEKTFLGGDASVELRVPVVQQVGADGVGGNGFADITVLFKYAFINDRRTGNVLSGGLAVTAPTGADLPIPGGELHPVLLQPWMGFLRNLGPFYVQGFTSLAVPTDSRDVLLLFNDVGIGYTLYYSPDEGFISAIVPTLEVHVTTPLDHRNPASPLTAPDLVVLTAGSHFCLGQNALLSAGVAAPVTGPRAFDVEALVQLNWRF